MAEYWNNVVKINESQKQRIYQLIVEKLYGNLFEKKIAILGFAFKANTNDTRESPSIDICKNLINEGAFLKIHDYKVSEHSISKEISKDFKGKILTENNWSFFENIYEATSDVDAIVILTEWEDYKKVNWQKIVSNTRKPAWIFDTRIILDPKDIKSLGINLWQLGLGDGSII